MDLGDFQSLIHYEKLGRAAQLSIPTPDHYFPLMYTLGLKTEKDELSHPIDGGISYGSTSMRSILISEG
jgi:4,5-DOPA dioxygenase extradiol